MGSSFGPHWGERWWVQLNWEVYCPHGIVRVDWVHGGHDLNIGENRSIVRPELLSVFHPLKHKQNHLLGHDLGMVNDVGRISAVGVNRGPANHIGPKSVKDQNQIGQDDCFHGVKSEKEGWNEVQATSLDFPWTLLV